MPLSARNQKTLDQYYEHTNSGDFAGAIKYFADDVVYRLPSASAAVPYAGEWRGKDGVSKVYGAFGAAYSLVDMTEICTVATENEVVSINDEIFVAKKTEQSWRAPVAHQFLFRDGLIVRLDVHTDLGAAHEAMSGRTSLPSALLPVDTLASAKTVATGVAEKVVSAYFTESRSPSRLLAPSATAFVTGDPRRLRFAGTWSGRDEFLRMQTQWSKSLDVVIKPIRTVAENGFVFAVVHLTGTFIPTKTPVDQDAAVLFQITEDGLIGRMAWYLNTYPLVALPAR